SPLACMIVTRVVARPGQVRHVPGAAGSGYPQEVVTGTPQKSGFGSCYRSVFRSRWPVVRSRIVSAGDLTDARVDFLARTGSGTVFLTPTAAVFAMQQSAVSDPRSFRPARRR